MSIMSFLQLPLDQGDHPQELLLLKKFQSLLSSGRGRAAGGRQEALHGKDALGQSHQACEMASRHPVAEQAARHHERSLPCNENPGLCEQKYPRKFTI